MQRISSRNHLGTQNHATSPYIRGGAATLRPFLLMSQKDQPFQFGAGAFDYRQCTDFLISSSILKLFADVVQVTHHIFDAHPILVRIDEEQQYLHKVNLPQYNVLSVCSAIYTLYVPCLVFCTLPG